MEPSLGYSSNKHFFFTDREARPIGRGLVLGRGYFQSVQPALDRMLINVDISTRAMYRSGKLIDLALEFLGKPGTPSALVPRHGLPDRERIRLQQFISGITVTMRYRTQEDTGRRRVVKKLTRECARDLKFEPADGGTMTVAEYFQTQLKIPLQFPDVICAEVCTTFSPSSHVFSYHVALDRRPYPLGAL
jgi:eukaryotic translation initiation factor 2C